MLTMTPQTNQSNQMNRRFGAYIAAKIPAQKAIAGPCCAGGLDPAQSWYSCSKAVATTNAQIRTKIGVRARAQPKNELFF